MFVQLEVVIRKTVQVEVDENVCGYPIPQAISLAGNDLFDPTYDDLNINFLEKSPSKFEDVEEICF